MSVLFEAHICPRNKPGDGLSILWSFMGPMSRNPRQIQRSSTVSFLGYNTVLWDLWHRIYPVPELVPETIPAATAPVDWAQHQAKLTAEPIANSVSSLISQDGSFVNMNNFSTELVPIDPTYFNRQFYEVNWLQNPYEKDCPYLDFF